MRKNVADLVRRRIADRVGQIDGRAPGRDDFLDRPGTGSPVAPRRVLRRELHVVGVAARAVDRGDRGIEAGLARHPQLALEVQVGGGDEHVDAAPRRRARAPRRRDRCRPALQRASAAMIGPRTCVAIDPHRFGVRFGGDREPGLDDVHAERRELPRQRRASRRCASKTRAPARRRAASCRRS